ncbi:MULTISPECIES: dTDP-4-dehydrorhamnose 3,5-epimerase family protein [Vibrio]|uniref:dTDP-4-dehydrorhamnose 3,5-epimerase family protein n=1 Tax=Vibrio TaxID=662 RepID=UPI0020756449|nr:MULTISPECIES: dTDP-4-dehydrorhamnose 3,5-epimerase family protein [Vibrio]USD32686.1 dTDP-4-dehydrorhamnose 3,5-epimerase family protein [Vibrio sp. SCSIO 43186]USD45726.1 dTDP-4-dehydrorhamnose 3,5-epimerase family protein [Vibrio sp. SCSIO 43145]USD69811.1 dTDP-4-dehydrorhamnose 3,5-epimerase family protein [Vibrio sp. SCSIO 43139]
MRNHWLYFMNITHLDVSGCYLIDLPKFEDHRGAFIKTFHPSFFEGTPISEFDLQEEFYSVSKKNVLRGLHFQEPPAAHNKIVTCLEGEVLDFFVDIRKSSQTYGKLVTVELNANKPQLVYLPKGIAHGFLTRSEHATLLYKTDNVYAPELDKGILWSSVGLDTEGASLGELIISERDQSFPSLENYESPFL